MQFIYNGYISRWEYYDSKILSDYSGKRAGRFIKNDYYTVILFKMMTRARKNIIITKLIIVYFTFLTALNNGILTIHLLKYYNATKVYLYRSFRNVKLDLIKKYIKKN